MSESTFVRHEPCQTCGSSDALARYTDGHGTCFSCGAYTPGEGQDSASPMPRKGNTMLDELEIKDLPRRRLLAPTLARYGYGLATYKGQVVQVAPYYNRAGELVAQKCRTPDKDFFWLGDASEATLFGQHLFKPGKYLIITEGEVDALSMSQAQGNRWAAVSVRNGALGAADEVRAQLDWVERFEIVVLMFDQDEAGQKAALEVAAVLSPGKARVARWSGGKDASDLLVAGRTEDLNRAFWDAPEYRPDGLLRGRELWDLVTGQPEPEAVPWPAFLPGLEENTRGLKRGAITTLVAGPATGKTTLCSEVAVHLAALGERVGLMSLEQSERDQLLGLLTAATSRPLHLESDLDWAALQARWEELESNIVSLRAADRVTAESIESRVRHLVVGERCQFVVVDNVSVLMAAGGGGNDRAFVDDVMQRLIRVKRETGAGIIVVAHLKRPADGKGWDQGRPVTMSDVRGSGMLEAFSDDMIALERDHQSDDPTLTIVRLLKCRRTGKAGKTDLIRYSRDTGRLDFWAAPGDQAGAGSAEAF